MRRDGLADRAHSPAAPGPHLRGDVVHDRHPARSQLPREAQVEVGVVDEDGEVGALAVDLPSTARKMPRRRRRWRHTSSRPTTARSRTWATRWAPSACSRSPPRPNTSSGRPSGGGGARARRRRDRPTARRTRRAAAEVGRECASLGSREQYMSAGRNVGVPGGPRSRRTGAGKALTGERRWSAWDRIRLSARGLQTQG